MGSNIVYNYKERVLRKKVIEGMKNVIEHLKNTNMSTGDHN